MTFTEWTSRLTAELRVKIPTVRASRRVGMVVLRHGGQQVVVSDEGSYAAVRIGDRIAFTPALEPETARVIAQSLAASFDVETFGRG